MPYNQIRLQPGRIQAPNMNQSTQLLQNSINQYNQNKINRNAQLLGLLDAQRAVNERNAQRQILEQTETDKFDHILANQQAKAINDRIFNMSDEELAANAGKFGVAPGEKVSDELLAVTDNYGRRNLSPEEYGNSIYNQMIKAGFTPEQAKAERDRQIAIRSTGGMSEAELEAYKAANKVKIDAFRNLNEALKDAGTTRTRTDQTVGGSSGRSGSGSSRDFSGKGINTIKDYVNSGMFDEADNSMFSLGDTKAEAATKMYSMLGKIRAIPGFENFTERDLINVVSSTMKGEPNKLFKKDPTLLEPDEIVKMVKDAGPDAFKSNNISTGGSGGRKQYSSTMGTVIAPGTLDAMSKNLENTLEQIYAPLQKEQRLELMPQNAINDLFGSYTPKKEEPTATQSNKVLEPRESKQTEDKSVILPEKEEYDLLKGVSPELLTEKEKQFIKDYERKNKKLLDEKEIKSKKTGRQLLEERVNDYFKYPTMRDYLLKTR